MSGASQVLPPTQSTSCPSHYRTADFSRYKIPKFNRTIASSGASTSKQSARAHPSALPRTTASSGATISKQSTHLTDPPRQPQLGVEYIPQSEAPVKEVTDNGPWAPRAYCGHRECGPQIDFPHQQRLGLRPPETFGHTLLTSYLIKDRKYLYSEKVKELLDLPPDQAVAKFEQFIVDEEGDNQHQIRPQKRHVQEAVEAWMRKCCVARSWLLENNRIEGAWRRLTTSNSYLRRIKMFEPHLLAALGE